MRTAYSRMFGTIGMMGVGAVALAGEPVQPPKSHPQEPVGFVAGAIVGGFAGGPIGAVVGAGVGTWLGNRVHRASDAKRAEAELAQLQLQSSNLQAENSVLITEQSSLTASNQDLATQLKAVSEKAGTAQTESEDASTVLDGLQGDVLFRTASAEISPDIAHQVQVIAQAVAKSPQIKVRVDGYADPRGGDELNMKLSQQRADAVRDLLLTAGLSEDALEVNAYGKTQSVAADSDGFALERRVRLTLRMDDATALAKTSGGEKAASPE